MQGEQQSTGADEFDRLPGRGILLSPMLAAAAMSLSSVSVIGNALRLRGDAFADAVQKDHPQRSRG